VFQIGTSLREARQRQGLEFVDAESATKIRSRYLHALEDEQFDTLPSPTYVKGFLRSYAEFLGLDGQLYVDEYNSRYIAGDDELRPVTRRSAASARAHGNVESRALVLALVGIASAAALVILAWKWAGDEPQRTPGVQPVAPPAGTQPASKRTTPVTGRKSKWIKLSLKATRGNTLLTVRRGGVAGNPQFSGTLERGRTQQFVGARLWLEIASPANVVATLNGHRYRLPGPRNEPIELVATRRGIRLAAGA
jgi:hypothetical protein